MEEPCGSGREPVQVPIPVPAARGPRVTLAVEPRFPGGTAAAVAAEIRMLAASLDLAVVPIDTRMFSGAPVNPRLADALAAAGIEPAAPRRGVVRGDVVVLHNPSCLKFDAGLPFRISCDTLIVVAHENFLRPNGAEGFDVGGCLDRIARAAVARSCLVAPVSRANRRGVEAWFAAHAPRGWAVAPFDWTNVCDWPLAAPNAAPRDRRGRHSRPGLEKFPPMPAMLAHFPEHAEHCAILGADLFLADPGTLPKHWHARPFGGMEVAAFLDEIDFFVYFTHPLWQESFGRVVAEAIAAGKLVITDPGTAESFGPGVIASSGEDVDALVAGFCANPASYRAAVEAAQRGLGAFAPERVQARILGILGSLVPGARPAAAREALHAVL